jgi:hypothetical protein
MDEIFNILVSAAGVGAILLVIFYGPLMAAVVVTGASFVLVGILIAFRGLALFDRWRQTRIH